MLLSYSGAICLVLLVFLGACQPIQPPESAATQAPVALPPEPHPFTSTPAAQPTPDHAERFMRLNDYVAVEDFVGAIAEINAMLDESPGRRDRANLLTMRSNYGRAMGDYEGAINDATAAYVLAPDDTAIAARAATLACSCLGLMERPLEALPWCNKAIAASPLVGARELRGLVYAQLGRYAEAVSDFTAYVDAAEADFATMVDTGKMFDGTLFRPDLRAQVRAYMDRRILWLEALKRNENPFTSEVLAAERGSSIHTLPTPTPVLDPAAAEIAHRIAHANININQWQRYAEAEAELTQVLLLDPGNRDALASRSVARRMQADDSGALADAEQIVSLYPNDFAAYVQRANVFLSLEDFERALQDAQRAVELVPPKTPESADPHFLQGVARFNLRDYATAIGDFDYVVALQPDRGLPYFYRGLSHYGNGTDPVQARQDLQRALDLGLSEEYARIAHDYIASIDSALK